LPSKVLRRGKTEFIAVAMNYVSLGGQDVQVAKVSLTLLVLKTRQVEQVRLFYQSLGIELAEEQHGKGPVHFAGRVGDVVIEVYPLAGDGTPVDSSTRLGFEVKNVAEVIEALQRIGIKIATLPKQTAWGQHAVRVRWLPFQLNPTMPKNGVIPPIRQPFLHRLGRRNRIKRFGIELAADSFEQFLVALSGHSSPGFLDFLKGHCRRFLHRRLLIFQCFFESRYGGKSSNANGTKSMSCPLPNHEIFILQQLGQSWDRNFEARPKMMGQVFKSGGDPLSNEGVGVFKRISQSRNRLSSIWSESIQTYGCCLSNKLVIVSQCLYQERNRRRANLVQCFAGPTANL
jgi:lactoylglutathione lyase